VGRIRLGSLVPDDLFLKWGKLERKIENLERKTPRIQLTYAARADEQQIGIADDPERNQEVRKLERHAPLDAELTQGFIHCNPGSGPSCSLYNPLLPPPSIAAPLTGYPFPMGLPTMPYGVGLAGPMSGPGGASAGNFNVSAMTGSGLAWLGRGAAGAGAQAAAVFGSAWVGLFSALMTLAILFLSEIIPKTIGAVYWKQLAPAVTRVLSWLMVPLMPLVWLSGLASRAISSRHNPVHVSRDEIRALADLGARQGVLDKEESRVVEALLRFRTMTASRVMTPRIVMFALPADDTVGDVVDRHRPLRFSRIPIFRGTIDSLVGFVLKDEILEYAAQGYSETPLSALRRELFFVPGTIQLSHLFDLFLSSREHIAGVIDEFGGTAGLVTLEDLVETLLDLEIVDEVDTVEDLREEARLRWRERATKLGLFTANDES